MDRPWPQAYKPGRGHTPYVLRGGPRETHTFLEALGAVMQHHTVQQIEQGPRAGRWIYAGGNRRIGRYAECCSEAWLEMLDTPKAERDASPAWDRIGHGTEQEAYAHMRARLLERLRLDVEFGDWGGCAAPGDDGAKCDMPTKAGAEIPPCHLLKHLCDEHRTREVVETMWDGPGDWSGSW